MLRSLWLMIVAAPAAKVDRPKPTQSPLSSHPSRLLLPVAHHCLSPSPPLPHRHSFHPDKSARMRGIIEYYIKGDVHALDQFPGGSEPGTRR